MSSPIIVLDEATSYLDAVNERLIHEALETLGHNHTTLVIAHRLSIIRSADLIVVPDGGQIVEMGTHEGLVHRQGRYTQLVATQLAGAATYGD